MRRIAECLCLASVVLALLIVGATPPIAGQETLLRIATWSGNPRIPDPYDQLGRHQADVENIYEPLVYPYRDTFGIRGVLAESWTSSEGGAVWTFKLRKGVRFHDGAELTAEAVKLAFERDRAIGRSTGSAQLADVREVRVVDPLTVQFVVRLAGGAPFLPRLTSFLIASPKAIREQANNPAWWRANAAGTGAYMLAEFVPRDRMVLRRFDGYWGAKPFFSRVIFLEILEPATQAFMIERGDVDIAYNIPPQSLTSMKRNPLLRVVQVPGDRVMNFRMNLSHGAFSKLALRKAAAYAMDYDALLKARQEELSPPEGPVPRQFLNGWVPPNLVTKQNLDKARQLLAEAGYTPGQLEVTLNIAAGSPTQATAAEVFQASLQKIGVRSRINAVEFAPMDQKLQRFARTRTPADAEDSMTLIRGPFVPHPSAYFSSYDPDYLLRNWFGYRNDRAQERIELGYAVERQNLERAIEYYRQAVELIVNDQPDLWLYVEKKIAVLRSNIQGYYLHPVWFPETHAFPLSRQ